MATEYELTAKEYLRRIYPEVTRQWYSMRGNRTMYCPNLDIAVGPFATERRYESEYDDLLRAPHSRRFIEMMVDKRNQNIQSLNTSTRITDCEDLFHFNRNARCFLSVEVENEVSRKHLVGGLVNASALGRVGVVVAWNQEKLRALLKLRNYLLFLASVGKNTFHTNNVLVLSKEQFEECFKSIHEAVK